MALLKSIASKIVNGVIVEAEKHIDMHPLEEEMVMAEWGIDAVIKKIPLKLTLDQEHELMVRGELDTVRANRLAHDNAKRSLEPELEKAQNHFNRCKEKWEAHVGKRLSENKNPDDLI